MKLRINKACDLNSISVLPPHSRKSNVIPSVPNTSSMGKSQASQLRSQSQQPFSQGMSLSQISQNSFGDNPTNDQRFGSQERDNSSKRIPSLAPIAYAREDSQLQLSRTSNTALHQWKSASVLDNRCQVSEEIEHKFRQMESSLSRLGMILDSVQSDVMQVNRGVKEVSLETEGIRQKIFLLENSMQKVLKGEEYVKSVLDGRWKSILDQIIKDSACDKLNEIAAVLSVFPNQIEARLVKLQHEVCTAVTKEKEAITNIMNTLKNNYQDPIQPPETRSYNSARRTQISHIKTIEIPVSPSLDHRRKASTLRTQVQIPKALKPKVTGSKQSMAPKQEEILPIPQKHDFRIIISDEESDGVSSCLLVKKETGRVRFRVEEADAVEESMRILRKARKRRRNQSSF